MRFVLPLIDSKGLLFGHSVWWLTSRVGTYSVTEGKGLFSHSVLVARFARGHYFYSVIESKHHQHSSYNIYYHTELVQQLTPWKAKVKMGVIFWQERAVGHG